MHISKDDIWNSRIAFPQNSDDQRKYADVVDEVVRTFPDHKTSWLEGFDQAIRAQVGSQNLEAAVRTRHHYTSRFYVWTQKHPKWALVLKILTLGATILIAKSGAEKYYKQGVLIRLAESCESIAKVLRDRNKEMKARLQKLSWEELTAPALKPLVEELRLTQEHKDAMRKIIEGLELKCILDIRDKKLNVDQILAMVENIWAKEQKLTVGFIKRLRDFLPNSILDTPQTYQDEKRYATVTKIYQYAQAENVLAELKADKKVYSDAAQWESLSRNIQKSSIDRMVKEKARFQPLLSKITDQTKGALQAHVFTTLSVEKMRAAVEDAKLLRLESALKAIVSHVKEKVLKESPLELFHDKSFRAMIDILGLQGDADRAYAFLQGRELYRNISELKSRNEQGWQESAVSLIRNSRQDTLELELERLRGANAIKEEELAKLRDALQNVTVDNGVNKAMLSDQAKVLYMQAHEIKRIYEGTHHVLLHAQSLKWSIVPMLIKELIALQDPKKDLHHYKFLRPEKVETISDSYWNMVSGLVGYVKNFLGYLAGIKEPATAQEFLAHQRSKGEPINDDKIEIREKILSVDGYFYNYYPWESALYFLMKNNNVLANGGEALQNILKSTLRHFKKDASNELVDALASRLLKSTDFTTNMVTTGNLYVIAIPKEKSEEIQYRAHPFGKECGCHPAHMSVLEKLQRGVLDNTTKCSHLYNVPQVPQFRIFLPALKPGNGSKMFRLNALKRDDCHSIKAVVKEVAKTLQTA